MRRLAVFGYGSLVSRASIAETLGRDVAPIPARLPGWRRRWSLVRDNARAEKGFEALDGESFDFCLGLNVEDGAGALEDDSPNGALIELTEAELDRLDVRELRYDRIDVSREAAAAGFDAVFTYTAKPENFAAEPPDRAVIIATYLRACESAFEELGPGQAAEFARTTGPPPVPVVEARLVRDAIPPGNPRAW